MAGLKLSRKMDQTWREAAIAQGARFGMGTEVAESFDAFVSNGTAEEWAAFDACADWDVLDFVDDEPTPDALKGDAK